MKIYKYTYMMISGTTDPYILYQNLSKDNFNISYYNPFNSDYVGKSNDPNLDPVDGIKINKLFSGSTITEQDGVSCKIDLDLNMTIFVERSTMVTEMIFTIEDKKAFDAIIHKITDKFVFEEMCSWKCGEETIDCSIISIVNDFVMNQFFPFASSKELKKVFDEFDPTERNDSKKYLEKMKEISGISVDLCGASMGLNSSSRNIGDHVILDVNKSIEVDDSFKKISTDYDIYYSDSLQSYVCFDEEAHEKFSKDYSNYLLYESILSGYKILFLMWSNSITKEAKEIIDNLENKNEAYWKTLRLNNEEWQLHFLAQNSYRTRSLTILKQHNILSFHAINEEKKEKWLNKIKKQESAMYRYVDEIKYELDNIATPGHTHDEQALQKVSETTNERILLLSFLAMSIPMLGAIFSPEFTLPTKVISASILLLLPIIYFSVFRFSKKRQVKLDQRRELMRRKKQMLGYIEYHRNNIEELKKGDLADDIKKNIIVWEERNIKVGQQMIAKIDKKLK